MHYLTGFATSLISLSSIMLVATAVTAIIAMICMVAVLKGNRRERARDAELRRLQAELKIFTDAAMTVGARLVRAERMPSSVSPAAAVARQSMQVSDKALELAQRGAGIDDLVAACDLSRSEAGLVLALQRRSATVRSAA